jgi:nucleolar GTP-binding protein
MDCVTKAGATFRTMSNFTEEGIAEVKKTACSILLARRIEAKMKTGNKVSDVVNRLSITEPKPRDGRDRTVAIPESVLKAKAAKAAADAARAAARGIAGADDDEDEDTHGLSAAAIAFGAARAHLPGAAADGMMEDGAGTAYIRRWLERDKEKAGGGPGVYRVDTTHYYDLKNPEWKTDIIPEIMDGRNIADYVDPDIEERLLALEAEEEALLAAEAEAADGESDVDSEEEAERKKTLKEVRNAKTLIRKTHEGKSRLPRTTPAGLPTLAEARDAFVARGMRADMADTLVDAVAVTAGKKRGRSETRKGRDEDDEDMGADGRSQSRREGSASRPAKRARSSSRVTAILNKFGEDKVKVSADGKARVRSKSRDPATTTVVPMKMGLKNLAQTVRATKMKNRIFKRFDAKRGEADRHVPDLKPKHLYSGKMGMGTRDRR